MENIKFTYEVQNDYNLQNKHLFKKKTGNAKQYYQLIFNESLGNDLRVLHKMYKENLPFRIFGLHTNLYITDNGYDGLFVDIDTKSSSINFCEKTKEFRVTSNCILTKFVNYTKAMGYDFSALTGIPGIIGGALAGNSSYPNVICKEYSKTFSDFVEKVIVYDFETGNINEIIPDSNFFSTRDSFIKQQNKNKTRYFIKEVVLKADYIGVEEVSKLYDVQINHRRKALKINYKEGNAGSFFSNPHLRESIGKSMAGILKDNPSINIDINGATFSPDGNRQFRTQSYTTDKDSAKFLQHIVLKVKELYNVDLHKEVIILDFDGEIDLETFIKRNS